MGAWWQRFEQLLKRVLKPGASSETVGLLASAVTIGVAAGLAAVALDAVINLMGAWTEALRASRGGLTAALLVLLVPALGGLLVAPIMHYFASEARGSGVPHVMFAVSNLGGRLPKRLAFWRPLATMLSVGSGGSLGTEGPVVQMSAAISSVFSDVRKLSDERRRSLVAVAAAGGVAATFNAPIAGVLFALEVILGRFEGRYFATVVVGAVSATAVSRSLLGDAPAFAVPSNYVLGSPAELPVYAVLGLLSAFVAVGFMRTIVTTENAFDRLRLPWWSRPALGGLAVGALALVAPEVLGRGYDTTGAVLQSEPYGWGFLLTLLVLKTLATGISIGSYGSGGIFAPALLVGATAGALFGTWMDAIVPALGVPTGAYALVGMAAVFAGVTRAAMSSIVMIFELSGSYDMILPLLLAAVVATLVSDLLHPDSYYRLVLLRRGLSLMRLRETDLFQTVRVREAMDKNVPTLNADDTLRELTDALHASHHHGFVVARADDPTRMAGIVTLSDLERAQRNGLPTSTPIRELCHREVQTAHPDDTASEVLERMDRHGIGRMPVVEPADPERAIGMVRQSDLARAYAAAINRQRSSDQVQQRLRLRELTGQEIVEVRVPADSPYVGVPLKDAGLPLDSIVVSVRRGGRTIFPHGSTVLQAGDSVIANVAPGSSKTFAQELRTPPTDS